MTDFIARLLIRLVPLFSLTVSFAELPDWTKKGQTMNGHIFTSACLGEGPSLDLARKSAIDSCKASAAQQLANSVRIKSISIETEKSAAFHQEVSQEVDVSGLVCHPKKEKYEDTAESVQVWILCQFDLSKTRVAETPLSGQEPLNRHSKAQNNTLTLVQTKGTTPSPGNNISSNQVILTLGVVPHCDELLVRGGKPRITQCAFNPQSIIVSPEDSEIIVRAKGYQSKSVHLKNRSLANENIEIILDPN